MILCSSILAPFDRSFKDLAVLVGNSGRIGAVSFETIFGIRANNVWKNWEARCGNDLVVERLIEGICQDTQDKLHFVN